MKRCGDCGRLVYSAHECAGNPRKTCAIYGCGRPIESYYDSGYAGHTVALGLCGGHTRWP